MRRKELVDGGEVVRFQHQAIPSASVTHRLQTVDVLHVTRSRALLIGSLTLSDQLCGFVGVVLTGRVEGTDFRLIKRCLESLMLPRNSSASVNVV